MKTFISFLATTLTAPLVAFAAIDTPGKVITTINKLSGWLYTALLALAVVFIVYAAFLFLTAGDNAEQVSKAKTQIIHAAVAVAVAILATGIIELVKILLDSS
ncbi:MAG: hypothetical protein V1656_01370 [Candidatus Jorgensenbacteria bacterium]